MNKLPYFKSLSDEYRILLRSLFYWLCFPFEFAKLIAISLLKTIKNYLCLLLINSYFSKFINSQWLLTEENAEIRRMLVQRIGYDRICRELDAIELNIWREYTLLKINADIDEEPMVLLKMTCPSTGHIHILRVPPEMTSAEAAITWVNHGIHPDEFAVQT